jgi:hypothetical protein
VSTGTHFEGALAAIAGKVAFKQLDTYISIKICQHLGVVLGLSRQTWLTF